ncbi:MAG: hypothetical protein ACXWDF_10715 [Aeromicrobium sp.]
MTDQHATALIQWALNTLGKAVAVSIVVGLIGGVIAGFALIGGATGFATLALAITGLAAPLAFAATLFNAQAPPSRIEVG